MRRSCCFVRVAPGVAQRVPSIVIPGRPDVPVIINGMDASWSVVEGDYGLDRPIGMVPTVIYRPYAVVVPGPDAAPPGAEPSVRHTFQATANSRAMADWKWNRRQTGRCRRRPRAFSRAGRANRRLAPSPNIRLSPRRRLSGTAAAGSRAASTLIGANHFGRTVQRQSSSASST